MEGGSLFCRQSAQGSLTVVYWQRADCGSQTVVYWQRAEGGKEMNPGESRGQWFPAQEKGTYRPCGSVCLICLMNSKQARVAGVE